MTKSELRRIYLEKRRSLSDREIVRSNQAIADRFFEKIDIRAVQNLHCFIPILKLGEIDTARIYQKLWAEFAQIQIVAPCLKRETGEIESRQFGPDTELVENKWGIREPVAGTIVRPRDIDMVVVPLLCFDRRGHRVGYGKGLYDRFLAACRPDCVRVGLSYFAPVDNIDDTNENDVRLDAYIAPDAIFDNLG